MTNPAPIRLILAVLIVLLPVSGLAEDFDDCVLKNATGDKSETQLKLIEKACLERTRPRRCPPRIARSFGNYARLEAPELFVNTAAQSAVVFDPPAA